MHVRIPALVDEDCPKCNAGNTEHPPKYYVYRCADERGPHMECDQCGHEWRITHTPVAVIRSQ